jgi:2-oxoisovalerate dehydrogenase E1 component
MEICSMPTSTEVARPQAPKELLKSKGELLRLYEQMVLLRRFELSAQVLNRNGKLPGFLHLYIGEEASAVGVCAHLKSDDWITSTHRGHGHALAKGVSPKALMAEINGKVTGICGGRGGSMHLYDSASGLFGTNGIVGGGIPSAVGAAISAKVRKTQQVSVAFFGDGAVNHGSFHESVNFATIQKAPIIFVCENNLYATATPLTMATKNTDVASKGVAYGIPSVGVDGNDVIAMWSAAKKAIEAARAGHGPTLIEARTYRTVGHHEGDPVCGTYRSKDELEGWKLRDPIANFKDRLLNEFAITTEAELTAIDARIEKVIAEAEDFGQNSPEPDPATYLDNVYADPLHSDECREAPRDQKTVTQGWLEAVRDGVAEEMRRDPHIIYFGEGIGERGGSFAQSKGLWAEFGAQRLIDTPISELGFTGASVGAAATGCRAVADLMFSDFLFEAASQIIHQASKLRYMSNGQMRVPMVLLAGSGEIKTAGPHHSGAYHPIWAHVPGLIVAVPSNPADAKGLMKTALRANDPVVFFEHKSLFGMKGEVPVGEHYVPFGVARVAREGTDLTIVSSGLLLHRSLEAAAELQKQNISCEVIDLRTIVPLDVETIVKSVAKTGKLLVVDEGHAMCGVGGEIAAVVMEQCFDDLDAPVGRLHTEASTHPLNAGLERQVVVTTEKIVKGAKDVLAGRAPIQRRVKSIASARSASIAPSSIAAVQKAAPQSAPAAAAVNLDGCEAVTIPHGDLTITEAKIVKWLAAKGQHVKSGEPVLEMETEKSVVQVEAPAEGILTEILADEGAVVKLGAQVGLIRKIKHA